MCYVSCIMYFDFLISSLQWENLQSDVQCILFSWCFLIPRVQPWWTKCRVCEQFLRNFSVGSCVWTLSDCTTLSQSRSDQSQSVRTRGQRWSSYFSSELLDTWTIVWTREHTSASQWSFKHVDSIGQWSSHFSSEDTWTRVRGYVCGHLTRGHHTPAFIEPVAEADVSDKL